MGGLPYERDGDVCWNIRIKTLKETNLGMAQALCLCLQSVEMLLLTCRSTIKFMQLSLCLFYLAGAVLSVSTDDRRKASANLLK